MNRRLPNSRATVALTGGDDRPAPACADNWHPFDVLIDLTAGPVYQAALRDARAMCGGCPVSATCLRDNRDEVWAKAVITGKTVMQRTAAKRARKPVAPKSRANNAAYIADYNATRLLALEDWAEVGLGLDDILERLGIKKDVLRKWCLRNSHEALWARLSGRAAA